MKLQHSSSDHPQKSSLSPSGKLFWPFCFEGLGDGVLLGEEFYKLLVFNCFMKLNMLLQSSYHYLPTLRLYHYLPTVRLYHSYQRYVYITLTNATFISLLTNSTFISLLTKATFVSLLSNATFVSPLTIVSVEKRYTQMYGSISQTEREKDHKEMRNKLSSILAQCLCQGQQKITNQLICARRKKKTPETSASGTLLTRKSGTECQNISFRESEPYTCVYLCATSAYYAAVVITLTWVL